MKAFQVYLREIAGKFPSQQALAKAIGMTPQRLSRALAGDGGYTFNTENCLRLAKAANRPPEEVLRAAGKSEIADLLEFLMPTAGKPTISAEQKNLLDDWALLKDDERQAFRLLIHGRVAERKRRAS